mmetsp:Transcript_39153/g.93584  ORF Transcript_39153/g.93584 Transcript_39153/m.93584 type:complete len:224 (-) Transcript_39153:66-737(-)
MIVVHDEALALLQRESQLIRVLADALGELCQKTVLQAHLRQPGCCSLGLDAVRRLRIFESGLFHSLIPLPSLGRRKELRWLLQGGAQGLVQGQQRLKFHAHYDFLPLACFFSLGRSLCFSIKAVLLTVRAAALLRGSFLLRLLVLFGLVFANFFSNEHLLLLLHLAYRGGHRHVITFSQTSSQVILRILVLQALLDANCCLRKLRSPSVQSLLLCSLFLINLV